MAPTHRRSALSAVRQNADVRRQQMAGAPTYDEKKVEEAVLALLYFGSFERPGGRSAWKTFDWGITGRLFEQGLIYDPRGKAKSVVFTPEGEARAKAACDALFGGRGFPGNEPSPKNQKGKRGRAS